MMNDTIYNLGLLVRYLFLIEKVYEPGSPLALDNGQFAEDSVIANYQGISFRIYLGEDAETEKFPRYMYNFIMELLENQ